MAGVCRYTDKIPTTHPSLVQPGVAAQDSSAGARGGMGDVRRQAAVARTAAAVVADLAGGKGRRTPQLVGEGLLKVLGGNLDSWRLAAAGIAARQVDETVDMRKRRAVRERVALPGGCADSPWPRQVTLGVYAVGCRRAQAAAALIARADDDTAAGMLRCAIEEGWEAGFEAMAAQNPRVLGDLDWRDGVLRTALEKPAILRRLITWPMTHGGECSQTRFFGGPRAGLNVALAMALTGESQREALLASVRDEAPAMLADMREALGQHGPAVDTDFFARLGQVVDGMDDAGLGFLAQHVCHTPKALWRLARAVAQHGRGPAQLEALCQHNPDFAARVAQQAGTLDGVRGMVAAIASHKLPLNLADTLGQRMAWVTCLAGMATRTPDLERALAGAPNGMEARLMSGWLAERQRLRVEQAWMRCTDGQAGNGAAMRRRRRA